MEDPPLQPEALSHSHFTFDRREKGDDDDNDDDIFVFSVILGFLSYTLEAYFLCCFTDFKQLANMAPRKKTSNMVWVVKSKQSAKMADPSTEKKSSSSSMMLDLSLLPDISKLKLSSSQPKSKEHHILSMPGWSLLPEELLHIISENLEDSFDVIHARSVCRSWRQFFPFPSLLLRTRYTLPSFAKFPRKSRGFCTLEKFHVFLFRLRASAAASASKPEFFVGGIDRDSSKNHVELSSPIQCSAKVKIPGSDRTSVNLLDCQILPLGYQYRMVGYDPQSLATRFRGVGFLPLNTGQGEEFVVLIGYAHDLLVLRSTEMKWMRLETTSRADCSEIHTFEGKFCVVFLNGDVYVIDPYSLEATPFMPSERLIAHRDVVPSGNDELFLVERVIIRDGILELSRLKCRVSRLDEDTGEWVVVTDLGDRVLLIGQPGNCSCSAKELPDGCGVSGNTILFVNEIFGVTFPYKYGVDTGNPEDLNFWKSAKETRVTILSKSPMAAHLQVETS